MFGTACAFPCSGVLTARYSMKAVLWFGIACQSALALTLCVVMTAESSLQRTAHGLHTDSTSEHGDREGGEGGEAKGCGPKLCIHACFAATFFLMGHMRGVVTVGSSFFYANEFGVSDQFGGWLSCGAFTLRPPILKDSRTAAADLAAGLHTSARAGRATYLVVPKIEGARR